MSSSSKPFAALTPMGLGTSRIASLGSAMPMTEARKLINVALDLGICVVDTADTYGSGDAERYIAGAIRDRREAAYLITKAGYPYVALPGVLSPVNQCGKKLLQALAIRKNYSKRYLIDCLEKSLRRLQVDSVDAFVLHEPVKNEASDESWDALERIRTKGMAHVTGVSTSDFDVVQRGIEAGQVGLVETSVYLNHPTCDAILELCSLRGVPVVANEVLRPLSYMQGKVDEITNLLKSHRLGGVGMVSVLIAYASSQPAVRTVLVGMRNVNHLITNKEALSYVDSMKPVFAELTRRAS